MTGMQRNLIHISLWKGSEVPLHSCHDLFLPSEASYYLLTEEQEAKALTSSSYVLTCYISTQLSSRPPKIKGVH
jgi:hypothetical protein